MLAEQGDRLVGCVAIVPASDDTAQLRWYLVDPSVRGQGLGKKLLHEAVAFCEECGYGQVILWTESALQVASHLYRSVGFKKVEDKPGRHWGVDVVEEKYELTLP